MKPVDKYADRERGDLSEYANMIRGRSAMMGGRDLEVLRAGERNNFVEVLDICDDVLEDNQYEIGDDFSVLWNAPATSRFCQHGDIESMLPHRKHYYHHYVYVSLTSRSCPRFA